MPSSVSLLESKLGPANLNLESKLGIPASLNSQNDISAISDAGFDSGFNDQDSASSQQSADSVKSDENSVMSSNNSDSRGSSLEKSPASDTQWGFLHDFFFEIFEESCTLPRQSSLYYLVLVLSNLFFSIKQLPFQFNPNLIQIQFQT